MKNHVHIPLVHLDFPRPSLEYKPLPNLKNHQNLPKMVKSNPNFLVLHFGLNLMKIWPKIAKLQTTQQPRPKVIKLFSCSTQPSPKFQLLIKTKIPTNEEVACLKSLRCCIYHANKC